MFPSTKFAFPHINSSILERHHLYEKLALATKSKVILLSAPAGSGKTTLLSTWLQSEKHLNAWINLDVFDNNKSQFWLTIQNGIELATGHIPNQETQAVDALNSQESLNQLIFSLIEIASHISPELLPFYIVLDDFHLITDLQTLESLQFFIAHLPPEFLLIISSRFDLPFPTARMRASGTLVEFRAADLRFSLGEAEELFREKDRLSLTAEQVNILVERTEGWAAGLQFAGVSLAGSKNVDEFLNHFSGTNHFVLDLLSEEVLANLDEDIRLFILKTSVLHSLKPDICNHITGRSDSKHVLTELERKNLFLTPLDEQQNEYRYHSLFAEVMRSHLTDEFPDSENELLIQAAIWQLNNDQVIDAIQYAYEAKREDLMAEWLERIAPSLVTRSEFAPICFFANQLHWETLKNHPRLILFFSLGLYLSGKSTEASHWLYKAESLRPSDPICRLIAFTIRILLRLHQGNELSELDLTLLEQEDISFDSIQISIAYLFATSLIIPALAESGNVIKARQFADKAIHTIDAFTLDEAMQPAIGFIYLQHGDILYQLNEIELATTSLLNAYASYCASGNKVLQARCCAQLSQIEAIKGNQNSSHNWLEEAEKIVRQRNYQHEWILFDTYRIKIWLTSRNSDGIKAWCQEQQLQFQTLINSTTYRRMADFNLVRANIALGRKDEAAKILDRWKEISTQGKAIVKCQWLILMAIVAFRKNEHEQCLDYMSQALSYGNEFVRLFLDEGDCIFEIINHIENKIEPELINTALLFLTIPSILSPEEKKQRKSIQGVIVQPLSDREFEVLNLVAQGLTNRMIADRLVIELGTVKRHVYNISSKLGVQNRTEAVHQARSMGLID